VAAARRRLSIAGLRARGCKPGRWGVVVLALLFCIQMLSACVTPTRAPVVSRDQAPRQLKNRPQYHRVKHGETLYSIAWRYGLDFHVLAYWNKIARPYTIYPGQALRLFRPPSPAPRVAEKRITKPQPAPSRKTLTPGKQPPIKSSAAPVRKQPARETASLRTRLNWRWPVKGKVAQHFVAGDPLHKGIKISGRLGQPVLAGEGGKVVYAGSGLIGYGRLVIIKHNKNYLSAYAHNRKLLVKEGQDVARGEAIAEMGRNGNRPMLHFEIRRNGAPVDPLKLLPKPG
jgi:lipoprotein NlpD